MRIIKIILPLLFLALTACKTNPSLQEYSADNQSGVVAIPVLFDIKGGPNKSASFFTEVQILNIQTNEVESVKIYYQPGYDIRYLNNFTPGKYKLIALRILPIPRPDVSYTGVNRQFAKFDSEAFEVSQNHISVIPIVFKSVQNSTPASGSWRFNFRPYELGKDRVDFDKFEMLLNTHNQNNQWVINWPWSTNS